MKILDLLRKRITEKIFDDMIERSDPSIKLIEQANPDSPFLEEIKETGNLPLDFQAIYDATVEMTNSDDGKAFMFFTKISKILNFSQIKATKANVQNCQEIQVSCQW